MFKEGAALLLLVALMSGCGTLKEISQKEGSNRGGYVDFQYDKFLPANNRKMRVLRGYAIAVGLSGIALETGLGQSERQAAAAQLISTANYLAIAYNCDDECLYFDTRMFDVNKSMLGLAKAALPIDEFIDLLSVRSLGGSTIGAVLEIGGRAIDIGGRTITGTLRVAAIYRDTWDLYMRIYIDHLTPASDGGPAVISATEPGMTVEKLRAIYKRGHGDIEAWKAAIRPNEKSVNRFLDISYMLDPSTEYFNMILDEMKSNCKLLTDKIFMTLCQQISLETKP